MAAQLSAERHHWEEAVVTLRTWNTLEQALKKPTIMVFEPMYLKILNNDMVGFANTTARDMLERLFLSYDSITAVDLEHNFENIRKSWDPQQPVETLFKLIMPRYFRQETSTVIAAVGMKEIIKIRLVITSKFTLQLPTANTSKYR
jgi:hypothetical protein